MEIRSLLPFRFQQKNYAVLALWFAGGRQPNAPDQKRAVNLRIETTPCSRLLYLDVRRQSRSEEPS
jgi:hypothetical protein